MENNIIKIASKILKDPKIDHRLLGGMSNYTYVVISEGKKYTVREIGEYAEHFVSRQEEIHHIHLFESLGVTNHTIYFDIESGEKISQYIEGDILTQIDPKPHLQKVSDLLKKIHQSGLKSNYDYDLFKRLDFYESINIKNHLDPKYFTLKKELLNLYETVYSKHHKVLTHGDSQRSNFILGKDKLYLVDFEFSGNNDPFYDIAGFGNKTFGDGIELLNIYLDGKTTNKDLKRLYFYKIFQSTQWYLVASFKHEKGMSETLKIPFGEVPKKYLNEALTLKGVMDEIDER